jgi:hypothetical protein
MSGFSTLAEVIWIVPPTQRDTRALPDDPETSRINATQKNPVRNRNIGFRLPNSAAGDSER